MVKYFCSNEFRMTVTKRLRNIIINDNIKTIEKFDFNRYKIPTITKCTRNYDILSWIKSQDNVTDNGSTKFNVEERVIITEFYARLFSRIGSIDDKFVYPHYDTQIDETSIRIISCGDCDVPLPRDAYSRYDSEDNDNDVLTDINFDLEKRLIYFNKDSHAVKFFKWDNISDLIYGIRCIFNSSVEYTHDFLYNRIYSELYRKYGNCEEFINATTRNDINTISSVFTINRSFDESDWWLKRNVKIEFIYQGVNNHPDIDIHVNIYVNDILTKIIYPKHKWCVNAATHFLINCIEVLLFTNKSENEMWEEFKKKCVSIIAN